MRKQRRGQPPPKTAPARPEPAAASPAAVNEPAQSAPPPAPPSEAPATATRPSLFDRLATVLPVAALFVVAAFAIRRVEDFDTWWHLASGRWIAQHREIPYTDVLSYTVPHNEWINLQWLYDLLLYWTWLLGGPNALVLASAASFVAAFWIVARHLRLYLGPIAATLLLVWVATTVNERFLIRPEMASFPLLAAVQLALSRGRATPASLRWLVPLMILWANMHSLFILGVGAIVCAIAGAFVAELPLLPAPWRIDSRWPSEARRQLLIWGGAAIAATLVNPYLLRALLFPLELMSRIDGSSGVYSVIGEFRPPFSGYFLTFAMGSYQAFVITAAVLAVAAGVVRALSRPSRGPQKAEGFDIGMLVFAAALAYLSLLARRNVGIFAIGAVPFVGACAGILLARLPASLTSPSALPVRLISIGVLAGTVVICGFVVSNRWYAVTGETHEFGLGVIESNPHPRASEFFREQKLPGPMFNDMTSGGYLTWDEPSGKGVYVDGRLEVYDTPFFGAYLNSLSNMDLWKREAAARGVQTVHIFHRWGNRHNFIRALLSSQDWRLVYYDETIVMFVRVAGNEEKIAAARAAFTDKWRPRTEALLSGPLPTWPWQWSIGRYTGILAYARVLETVGEKQTSLKWFEAALAVGLPDAFAVEAHQRAATYLASAKQFAQARVHLEKAIAADPANESSRTMLTRLDAISR